MSKYLKLLCNKIALVFFSFIPIITPLKSWNKYHKGVCLFHLIILAKYDDHKATQTSLITKY